MTSSPVLLFGALAIAAALRASFAAEHTAPHQLVAASSLSLGDNSHVFLAKPAPFTFDARVFGMAVKNDSAGILHFDSVMTSQPPVFLNLAATNGASVDFLETAAPVLTVGNAIGETMAIFKGANADGSSVIVTHFAEHAAPNAINMTLSALSAVPSAASSDFHPICTTDDTAVLA